jgi:phosphatidylserine/phosphatidylglycerophosphate/cardiolipin synthase-like enzyme
MKAANRPRPEIVLVLPKQLPSWVEAVAMAPPRVTMLEQLRDTARATGTPLGLYYTAATAADGSEVPVLIHSKLMTVDDRFLTIGSANTSNRSMGLDTELNVSWEATSPDDRKMLRSVRRTRANLLAEHCGLRKQPDARRLLGRKRGLVAYLDQLAAAKQHRLRVLTPEAVFEDREWVKQLQRWGLSFDPEKPVIEETLYEALAPDSDSFVARGLMWFRRWLGQGDSAQPRQQA